jgi:luciferase family oxidoreductase group 1
LAGLFPGRVDLGVGRAGGPAHDYPQKVAALLHGLGSPTSDGATAPCVWLLGSSTSSAALAAGFGTAFCYAHFLNPLSGVDSLASFRRQGGTGPTAVAVRVFVADTEADAARAARGFLLWRSRKDLGQDLPLPAPDTVRRHHWSDAEATRAEAHRPAVVYGAPEQVRDSLVTLAERHDVDEIVVNTLIHDQDARLRSYRLLAEAVAEQPQRRQFCAQPRRVG